jgi:tRNA threonylcarbamoyl adenosine modification protein (Sua5/YciO/YrdC/YwlC family)
MACRAAEIPSNFRPEFASRDARAAPFYPFSVICYFAHTYQDIWKGSSVQAEIIKIRQDVPEASLVRYVADQIKAGYVLGMPTDTFYGLAADPFNLRAVDRVYDIKSRSRHKPLSLLIESVDQAEDLARPLPEEFYKLARKFWPGPLTIIVQAASRLPLKVTANTGNVALRVPSAAIPIAVIKSAGIPITATSANLSGAAECTTAEQVRDQLQERISIIVDGGTSPRDIASTIVDLSSDNGDWRVIREGAIPTQEISQLFSQQG